LNPKGVSGWNWKVAAEFYLGRYGWCEEILCNELGYDARPKRLGGIGIEKVRCRESSLDGTSIPVPMTFGVKFSVS
jgi:hypothetical protein